jgi:type IV secretory pathway TraG/TraD family ATPase VirD4
LNTYAGLHLSTIEAIAVSVVGTFASVALIVMFFFIRRGKVVTGKEPGTTGRLATKREIIKNFAIPSKSSVYFRDMPRIVVAAVFLGVVASFITPFTLGFMLTISVLGSMFVGLVYVGSGNMDLNLKLGNHFQFGRWRGRRVGLVKKLRCEGILVVAPPGAGKTASELIPNIIADAKGDCSDIVVDIKPDENMADIVGSFWQAEGKPVIYFDPFSEGPAGNLSINPLLMIDNDFEKQETFDAILEIIDMFFKTYAAKVGEGSADTDHYKGREERLLRCILMAVLKMRPECRNLPMVLDAVKMPPDELNRFIASTGDMNIIAEYAFFVQASGQERNNSMQGLYRKLQFLDSPTLRKSLYRNDFDFDMLFKKPCLFIIKAELHRDEMGFMASLLIRLIMRRHLHFANPEKCKGFKKKPTWYYLDEFAQLNIPQVHNFATTIRSGEGGLVIIAQALDDLATYMKRVKSGSSDTAFESALRTKIVLPGCHPKTCQDISKMLGEITYKTNRRTKSFFSFIHSYQEQAAKAALLTADDIQYMDEDKALILSGSKRPFFVKQIPYYKDIRIIGFKGYLEYHKARLAGERSHISKPVNYYKVTTKDQLVPVSITDLLQERAADSKAFMPIMDKVAKDSRVTDALQREDRETPQAERLGRMAKIVEEISKEGSNDGNNTPTMI